MKKLSLIAAGLVLSIGLLAFAVSSNDGPKAKECAKTSCEQSTKDKAACEKLQCCDVEDCCMKCPAPCPPGK